MTINSLYGANEVYCTLGIGNDPSDLRNRSRTEKTRQLPPRGPGGKCFATRVPEIEGRLKTPGMNNNVLQYE